MDLFCSSEAFLHFDGAVLECFSGTQHSNGRVHAATIREIKVDRAKGRNYLQPHLTWGSTPFLVYFDDDRAESVAALVAEVLAVRDRLWGN